MIRRVQALVASPIVVCAALTLSGCWSNATQKGVSVPPPGTGGEAHNHDHAHAHPSEGPHHGDIVELGNEEYHAEIVHGDAGAVTVYVLDGAAKAAVPIDATEVVLNVTHDAKPEQFQLPAAPESSDPQGKSSKFSVTNAQLAKHLDDEHSSAKLVLTIAGKQFTGKVEHHHERVHDHK